MSLQKLVQTQCGAASIKSVAEGTGAAPAAGEGMATLIPHPGTPDTAHSVLISSTQSYGQINLPALHVPLRTVYEIMVWETNQKLVMCGWEASNCARCFYILVQWSKHSLLTDCSEVWC